MCEYPNGLLFRLFILHIVRPPTRVEVCHRSKNNAESVRSTGSLFNEITFMSNPGITRSWLYSAMLLSIAVMVGGCTAVGDTRALGDSEQLVKEAQEAVKSGAKIRAQKLLEEATKVNPADKTSWINLAQLHFDEGNYAQAITAGQEVLARDPRDEVARSIVLVSSLRVAAKSLAEMRELNQWGGDARAEAKKVATILREKLGEEVLVPDLNSPPKETGKIDSKGNERKAVKTKKRTKPKIGAVPPRPVTKSTAPLVTSTRRPPESGRADPFGSLR